MGHPIKRVFTMSEIDTWVVLRDGVKVHVVQLGDDKSKPLLIALHGAPGLSDHLEPKSSFGFLSTRFRVLVYDARGSGVSDLKGPYTDAQWISDVDELRAWAGAERFVLAGGSYGGFLALQYILAHPERVEALILRDTWAAGLRGTFNAFATLLTDPRLKVDIPRQVRLWTGGLRDNQDFVDAFEEIKPIYTPPAREGEEVPDEFEGVAQDRQRLPNYEAQNYAFAYNQPRFDVRSRLAEIVAPTLVIVGRHDVVCPLEYSEELAAGIPNSELAIFENSGHAPPSDEPIAFRERLSKFLTGLGY
ncbi:alpha/beta hydrolase fold protein [Thozetella sp. PMI_491]|nr:alpha/beta hydrolase fold protein [Thozetella sp. PMI_491]